MKIYKYPIPVQERFTLDLPDDSHILTVQVQDGRPMAWAWVDPNAKVYPRHFAIIGTGQDIPEDVINASYVGTFQMPPYVWHLFEVE